MGMVVVVVCLSLFPANPVEEVGRDIMHIHQFHSSFLHNLAIPLAIRVITTLYLSSRPFVAWCKRHENRCCTLLPHILYELLEIPSEGIHYFIFSTVGKLIHMTCVLGACYCSALLLIVNRTNIIVSELNQDVVTGLETIIHFVPTSLVEECTRAASSLCTVYACNLVLVEHGVSL